MEIELKEYKYKSKKINIKLNSKYIYGIIGKNIEDWEEIIKINSNYNDNVLINKKVLLENELNSYKKRITILKEKDYLNIHKETIYDLMEYILKQKKIYPKNTQKKIKDSLRIVGLNKEILNRNLVTLSRSETKLLQIAISLLSNPDVLIIEEPFKYLDIKTLKNLMIVLRKMKDQYNKIVIFLSKDIEKIYQNTDNTIIYNKGNVVVQGKTKEVFKDVELLKENKIGIPEIVNFTYEAKLKKSVKLDYHQNIRDIIKDIYKHV